MKLWNVESGEELEGPGRTAFRAFCYAIAFSPDGMTLVTVEPTGGIPTTPVRSWNISTDRRRVRLGESLRADELSALPAPVRRPVSPGERPFRLADVLAVTQGDDQPWTGVWPEGGELRLFRKDSGYYQAICHVEGPEVVVLPRHDLPVPYSRTELDAICRAARALSGCARARLICQDKPVLWVKLSRDGRTAAIVVPYPNRPEGRLRLIDVATGGVVAESPWGDVSVSVQFEFAREGGALDVVGFGPQGRVWDFTERGRPDTLRGHEKEVWGLAFSPDGTSLASAADDHTLKLWDVATGRERATLQGHGSLVTAVA